MPIQTTYAARLAPGLEGMVANSEPYTVISRIVETAGGIGFGKVVVQGTNDDQIRVSEASRAYRGVTVLQPAGDPPASDIYAQRATAAVMTKGVIWVTAGAAVQAGQPAYYVPATGVITNVSTSNTAIPNAIFDSSAASGDLVKLRLA